MMDHPGTDIRGILLMMLAGLFLGSCVRAPEKEAAKGGGVASVRVATVEQAAFADEVEALGTVRAMESIDVSANVTETVKALHFEDGDRVKEGQLLAELNDAEELATLEAARAQLEEQAREAERLGGLVKGGAVSEVRLQAYETQMEIAQRKIEEVEARIADRRLEAPFAGVLGFRRISVGALVSPGDVITTLDVMDPVRFDFQVPETFLSDLRPGLEVEAESEAWPGEIFAGQVTQIDSRVNPVTRSVTVRAEVPNKELKLRPGMLMTTHLSKNPTLSPAIPERSLLTIQQNQFVFVVDESEGAPVARRTEVKVGRRRPGLVEIVEGLQEGQQVISDGLLGVRDGVPVKVLGEFEGPASPYYPGEDL